MRSTTAPFAASTARACSTGASLPRRALEEIDFLSRPAIRRAAFYATDNILDLDYFETVLRELGERPRPPRLYYMMKSNLHAGPQLRLLARAGLLGHLCGHRAPQHADPPPDAKGSRPGLQNVRLLKWSAEVGLAADWASAVPASPAKIRGEYQRLAELVPSLTHLRPPGGLYQIRVDRFSPYFTAPEAGGLAECARRHRVPARLSVPTRWTSTAWPTTSTTSTRTGAIRRRTRCALRDAIEQWRRHHGSRAARAAEWMADRLEIEDSRPAAAGSTTVVARAGAAGVPRAWMRDSTVAAVRGGAAAAELGAGRPRARRRSSSGWKSGWTRGLP